MCVGGSCSICILFVLSLSLKLSAKKAELAVVYREHHAAVAIGRGEQSQLHMLIMSLLAAIQGADADKRLEAARCLGELGPIDLGTTVLKTDTQQNIYKFVQINSFQLRAFLDLIFFSIQLSTFENATRNLCQVALEKLNALLLHPDARVLKAVSEAVVFLLKTEFGEDWFCK